MPTPANHGRIIRCRRRRQRSRLQPHATRRPARLATAGQLMPQGTGLLLPRLAGVPLIHRVVADDRMAVMLAKALAELDIAVPVDWKKAECDPTSFTRFTLERWIKSARRIGHPSSLPAGSQHQRHSLRMGRAR